MLMTSSKLFLFSKEAHLNSAVRLLSQLYCVEVIKHVAFFTIYGIHIYTSLPLNFNFLFPYVVVVSELNKNIGGSTDLVKKRHRSVDLHTPFHSPHESTAELHTLGFQSQTARTASYN